MTINYCRYNSSEVKDILTKANLITGAAALEATLTAMKGAGWTTETLKALKDLLVLIPTTAMRGTDNAALASSWTSTRAGYVDELAAANLPADVDILKASSARQLFKLEFWSIPQTIVEVTTAAGNKALPDVVVSNLPTGAVIVNAFGKFRHRYIYNSDSTSANVLLNGQHIQIQKGGAGGYVDCISFVDGQYYVPLSGWHGFGESVGDHNVVAKVDGNATYNFQWTSADVTSNSLYFGDVQTGIELWYSV